MSSPARDIATPRALHAAFGKWVAAQAADVGDADRESLRRLACAVSHALHLKHTCLDLELAPELDDPVLAELLSGIGARDVAQLGEALRARVPGPFPLVFAKDGRRVWLHKYRVFETAVAQRVRELAGATRELTAPEAAALERCFAGTEAREQKTAVRTALCHGLAIVTGGPGTGKTWTVARLIAALQEGAEGNAPRIALAAPTGKAANRMKESLDRETAAFQLPVEAVPRKARTLHSLLGIGRYSPRPRHHARNPLPVDVLIVDEASMVDLPMMYRLLQALAPGARLVLLGDKDQLASVEAGGVLAELSDTGSGLYAGLGAPPVAVIRRSRRYAEDSGIGLWARAINAGGPLPGNGAGVEWREPDARQPWSPAWLPRVVAKFLDLEQAIADGADASALLQRHSKFQVLCALRRGPYGVSGINEMVTGELHHGQRVWYPGKPLMVTANDHERGLYNGDVGLVLPDSDGDLRACFLTGERDDDGTPRVRRLSRAQLPAHETSYAVTVHKAQGSEYDEVLLVLPPDPPEGESAAGVHPVLSRELVYTGLTRARSSVEIWAGRGVLETALKARTVRMSGLGF